MDDGAKKPIAVDGAETFLGLAIVRELMSRDVPVRAVTARSRPGLPEGVDERVAPLGDGGSAPGGLGRAAC